MIFSTAFEAKMRGLVSLLQIKQPKAVTKLFQIPVKCSTDNATFSDHFLSQESDCLFMKVSLFHGMLLCF